MQGAPTAVVKACAEVAVTYCNGPAVGVEVAVTYCNCPAIGVEVAVTYCNCPAVGVEVVVTYYNGISSIIGGCWLG